MANYWLLVLPLLIPVLGGLAVALLKPLDSNRNRRIAVAATLILTVAAVALVVFGGDASLVLFNLTPTLPVLLKLD